MKMTQTRDIIIQTDWSRMLNQGESGTVLGMIDGRHHPQGAYPDSDPDPVRLAIGS